ncbi:hypothetical protein PG996_012144 [Apiospora saccharicola]|uniref:Secreted protein n=1 Tax=Apiospora saccharicola TaxID=335842 RepID=A0ABR1U1R4_9PEZI
MRILVLLPFFATETPTSTATDAAQSRRVHDRPRVDEPVVELTLFLEAAPERQRHLHGVRHARVAALALLGAGPAADHVLALHAAGPTGPAAAARGGRRRRLQVVDGVTTSVHESEADAVIGLVRDRGLVVGGSITVVGKVVIVGIGYVQTRRGRVGRGGHPGRGWRGRLVRSRDGALERLLCHHVRDGPQQRPRGDVSPVRNAWRWDIQGCAEVLAEDCGSGRRSSGGGTATGAMMVMMRAGGGELGR